MYLVYIDGVGVVLKNYIEYVIVEFKKNMFFIDILFEYLVSVDIFIIIVYKFFYVYIVVFGEILLCCYVV